ncbi:Uncharacterized protein Adt_01799 [Abeliophyllum distichum]|uniref:MULE transposase domain-containing protein n=1 Tax=Abeliophyllum distichum TaxID=126358 RepID=A0ABD1VU00_9LAMI
MDKNVWIWIPNMGDSDELQSVDSEENAEPISRKRTRLDAFNDSYKELKRTNVGTIAQVEGYGGEFKRIYICLGPLKNGFIRGCMRVIGVDGCFIKTEHGGQLLIAVGVKGKNGMYPLALAVVDVENRENWMWFLGLLKDNL